MDRDRYSFIAHEALDIMAPVSATRLDWLIDALDLPPSPRVIDIGCGKGDLLRRLARRRGASGVGLEQSRRIIDVAREKRAEAPDADIQLLLTSAGSYPPPAVLFDAAFCIGAVHAFGRFEDALRGLSRLVRPGRLVVIGESFFKKPPAPEYLKALGLGDASAFELPAMIAAVQQAGLSVVDLGATSDEEIETYEREYRAGIERFVDREPKDPDGSEMLLRARDWWKLYERYGRESFSFALFVLQRNT